MSNNTKKNLGPIDKSPCLLCGRRHHLYRWPQKCYEASERADYYDELTYDRKAYAQMSQVEKDAHDNI